MSHQDHLIGIPIFVHNLVWSNITLYYERIFEVFLANHNPRQAFKSVFVFILVHPHLLFPIPGCIAKHIKRFAFITAGATFNVGLLIVLWIWKPHPGDIPNFFVVAACLGLCDAIWQTQTYSTYVSKYLLL